MSKTNTFENEFLLHVFNNSDIALIGDATGLRGSTTAGSLHVSLHTADPGETGDQTTNEANYTSYARIPVARSAGGWTVTNNSVSPTANVDFPAATGGSNTITHWGVGTSLSGAGKLLFRGVIGSKLGPFTAATDDNITIPGLSGVAVSDRIAFYPSDPAGLPTGITEATVYFVKTVSGAVVTISTTDGGATVDITTVGDGLAFKVTPIAVSTGVTPRITTGSTIVED
jgi:hypothetical protein